MPYDRKDPYQKALTRWNNRHLWRNVPWKDYRVGAKGAQGDEDQIIMAGGRGPGVLRNTGITYAGP